MATEDNAAPRPPVRHIHSHRSNGCNWNLDVITPDDVGPGGAPTSYQIVNVSEQNTSPDGDRVEVDIRFQNGPPAQVGTNGVTQESLTAVLIDRLEGFQRGPYACDENAEALGHYRRALAALKRRTEVRTIRGVEGTHEV